MQVPFFLPSGYGVAEGNGATAPSPMKKLSTNCFFVRRLFCFVLRVRKVRQVVVLQGCRCANMPKAQRKIFRLFRHYAYSGFVFGLF